ncbi:MAG: hypothetical protein IT531_08015 [Burkholderiales bacterium]|nr:hypothetical protein [Burkholderiales bacterium]
MRVCLFAYCAFLALPGHADAADPSAASLYVYQTIQSLVGPPAGPAPSPLTFDSGGAPLAPMVTRSLQYNTGPIEYAPTLGSEESIAVPNASGMAFASMDLLSGKFAFSAYSDYLGPLKSISATSHLAFADEVTFTVPGASNTKVTPVTFTLDLEGAIATRPDAFTGSYAYASGSLNVGDGSSFRQYVCNPNCAPHWGGHDVLRVDVNITGPSQMVPLLMLFNAQAMGAMADFTHTATLRLTAPIGTEWATASGATFAQPVPEPRSVFTMLVGLGLIGCIVRRSSRA